MSNNSYRESKVIYPLGFYIIAVLILLTSMGPYYGIQQMVLFIFLPILAVLGLLLDIKTLSERKFEFLIYLLLFLVSLISVFYYANHNDFETDLRRLIAAVVASYAVVGINKKQDYELFFHLGYILGAIGLIYIEYAKGNFSLTGFASLAGSRDRFFFNANYYSYISYFANFSILFLHLKYRNRLTLVFAFVLPILFLVLAFITQSRSGLLLIAGINIVFWFFIYKVQVKTQLYKISRLLLLLAAVAVLSYQFYNIFQGSDIEQRFTSSGDDSRLELAKEGLKVFSENPILGVGLGQFPNYTKYRQFSHNSFAESLAEHGIIGGFILFALLLTPLIKSYKTWKNFKNDPFCRLNLVFFTTFLLYNNAYVFYKFSFAMIYFFLFISFQYKLIESKKNSSPNTNKTDLNVS